MAERAEIVLSAVDRTKAAFASAQSNLTKLQATAVGAAARFGTIGAAITSAFAGGVSLKGAIDVGDQLNKLSQKTDVAVGKLSELRFAGQLADVDLAQLGKGLRTLGNNMAAAAAGNREQIALFNAMGVAIKNTDGSLRSVDDVLLDIADKFETYADGAGKGALASKVFGDRLGTELIPLLNQGSRGIREAGEEARRFGAVFSGDLARKSEQFNDNLTRIATAMEGLKIKALGGLIDGLVTLSEKFLEVAKNGDSLFDILNKLVQIGNAPQGRAAGFILDSIGLNRTETQKLEAEAERIKGIIVGVQNTLERDPGNPAIIRRLANLQKQFEAASAAAQTASAKTAGSGFVAGAGVNPAGLFTKKKAPPIVDGSAAANADALLRAQLANRLKALEDVLSQERDDFAFHERYLQQVFDDGRVSLDTYYRERTAAAQRALDAQIRILDEQVAAQRAFAAKASDPKDRERAEGEVDELRARQAKLRADFARDAVIDKEQQSEATKRLNDSYRDLLATLEQLSGNSFGADAIRNAQQVKQARRLLAQAGGDQGQADRLARLLADQTALAQIRERVSNATEDAAVAEERYLLAAEGRGDSLATQEREIYAIRSRSLSQLQQLAEKTAALAAASNNPELQRAAEQIRLQFERAAASVDPLVQRINDASRSLGDGIASSFGRAIVEGGKLSDLLKDIEQQILTAVTRILVVDPLATSIANGAKALGKSIAGSGGGSDLIGSLGSFLTSLFHEGGIAGTATRMRAVSPLVFAGAERYHSGGLAGLAPDEVPAILKRREEVLTTGDPRHRDNGGGRPVNVTIHQSFAANTSRQTIEQAAASAAREARRALSRGTA